MEDQFRGEVFYHLIIISVLIYGGPNFHVIITQIDLLGIYKNPMVSSHVGPFFKLTFLEYL